MNLSHLIKAWREKSNLTLRDAAKVVGISHVQLYRVESGKALKPDTLAAIFIWLMKMEKTN